ncbi:MAG: sigma-54-dependent Fis family transcriptional regulator [Candidatus Aminicenantes bacterium]|nr:sigma-54-dependent Fis family transcriptional regulator [Candidatus Aminicenantes bacterium]
MNSILFVSKVEGAFQTFRSSLPRQYSIAQSDDKSSALAALQKKRYDFIFIDIEVLLESESKNEYRDSFLPFWDLYPTLEIVVLCKQELLREAVKAVKAGANTYLTYPLDSEELIFIINSIQEYKIMESELDYLRAQFWHSDDLDFIQTKSPAMQNVFEKIQAVAPTRSTVLLQGETGTGKGVLANLIHRHSHRCNNSFITVHCGAIPDTLLESDLFGHEKGSFTGADRRRLGKFEIAKGGTIFLDEIGTISPSAQIKLLQILQDQTFQRVGGDELITADVRIITATNTHLEGMCDEGKFRKDLYYRLNVFPIEIPPLRERRDDIPHICRMILKKINRLHAKDILAVQPRVMEAFLQYEWPGNIRELENLIERAYILESSSVLTKEGFPAELFEADPSLVEVTADTSLTLAGVRQKAVDDIEKRYLKILLAERKGRIKDSARTAGISTRQLHKLMKKYGLRKEEFKPLF